MEYAQWPPQGSGLKDNGDELKGALLQFPSSVVVTKPVIYITGPLRWDALQATNPYFS